MRAKDLRRIVEAIEKLREIVVEGDEMLMNGPNGFVSTAGDLITNISTALYISDMEDGAQFGGSYAFQASIGNYEMAKDIFESGFRKAKEDFGSKDIDRYLDLMTQRRTFTRTELREGLNEIT